MLAPTSAVVLAGGGTKGAFEVGVLQHLVVDRGWVPGVVAATSAGSVLGAVLAQARTPAEFTAAVATLRADLLAMTRTDVVFGRQPWVAELAGTPAGDVIDAFTGPRLRPAPPADVTAVLSPPATGSAADVPESARPRRRLRLHDLAVLLRELPSMRRSAHALRSDRTGILNLDPLERALRGTGDSGIAPVDESLVARPGLVLRLGVTALGAGDVHYVTETGHVVGPDAVTPLPGRPRPGVVEGVLTSSSVPMLIPPRRIGGEVYCDGGVLQNVPVEAAVRAGATDVVAVLACPLATPRDPRDFATLDFVSTHLRTTAIGFSDQQRTNLAFPLPADGHLTVVAPTVDLVGPFEVSQGLMLVDMDYGAMRAAEAFSGCTDADLARARDATDAIVVAREAAWYLEEALAKAAGTARGPLLAALARRKDEIATQLDVRAGVGLAAPRGAASWAAGWEHHDDDVRAALPAAPH